MKRLLFVIGTMIAVALMGSTSAFASSPTLDLSPLKCTTGTLVVDVTQRIVNDADSGVGGNYWAFDAYKRHIQVWQTVAGTFCATVSYGGTFTTVAGLSPQNTGTVAAGIHGNFRGGYLAATFTGTLLATRPTGSLGTFDYACVLSANNTVATCSIPVWTTFFFSSTTGFALNHWGWIYTTEANGTWVNASTGNLGDIKGVPPTEDNGGNQNGGDQNGDNQNGNH